MRAGQCGRCKSGIFSMRTYVPALGRIEVVRMTCPYCDGTGMKLSKEEFEIRRRAIADAHAAAHREMSGGRLTSLRSVLESMDEDADDRLF